MLSIFANLQTATAFSDGGCLMAIPQPATGDCSCDANPTVKNFAACVDGHPSYFDDSSDIPNGACISFAHGTKTGTSLTTCSADDDCLADLVCNSGSCADSDGNIEANRLVTTCVSPKQSSDNILAGCPYGGAGNADKILDCHKYWIGEEGMQWKRYVQHNPLGQGDTYAWAYDEAVCATADQESRGDPGYPWCKDQGSEHGAVDNDGNVTDSGCPCAVDNVIAPLGMLPFEENGYGKHLHLHVYNVMSAKYVPPTKVPDYEAVELADVPEEEDKFFFKVVNQFEDDILVYLDSPPARHMEPVTAVDANPGKWDGWTGPKQTLRGKKTEAVDIPANSDPWVERVTIAPNDNPSAPEQPTMRMNGADSKGLGGFYVPSGYHLRIHIATKGQPSGWFQTRGDCPATACGDAGTSLWVTRADAYSYPGRDPLLLFEPNVNAFDVTDPAGFDHGQIWFDVSGVDGINANMELIYGKVDRKIFVPLFES